MIKPENENRNLVVFGITYQILANFKPNVNVRFFKCYDADQVSKSSDFCDFANIPLFSEAAKNLIAPGLLQELAQMQKICFAQQNTVMYACWSDCEISYDDMVIACNMANEGRTGMLEVFCQPSNVIIDVDNIVTKKKGVMDGNIH